MVESRGRIVAAAWLALATLITGPAFADACDKNHYILDEPLCQDATEMAIGAPLAVATDPQGNVYFSVPNLIFKLDTSGHLLRIAGSAEAGFAGDGGPATQALLNFPTWYPQRLADQWDFDELLAGLAVDGKGNLYIADGYNGRIRKIDANGIITTFAVAPNRADAGESASAIALDISWPQSVAVDADGEIFVTDGYTLTRIMSDGRADEMAGNDCGEFRSAGICGGAGIAASAQGGVYIGDEYCRVRMFGVGADANASTIAGDDSPDRWHGNVVTCGYSGDGGPALGAALGYPYAVALDTSGSLFVALGNCIRKIDTSGLISTIAGDRCDGRLDSIGEFAGDGGPAIDARLNDAHGVAVDAAGNVYIADTQNMRIRKVDAQGIITTVAGNGQPLPSP